MVMLRIAEEKDFPNIKAMAKKFFEDSPYVNFPIKEEYVDEYIKSFLTPSVSKMVILAEETNGGELAGFLAFELGDWLFYPVPVAVEKAMWVEPKYRKSKVAQELLGAFFFWAAKIGCPLIQMSSLPGKMEKALDKFYKKMKFEKVENVYVRLLTNDKEREED